MVLGLSDEDLNQLETLESRDDDQNAVSLDWFEFSNLNLSSSLEWCSGELNSALLTPTFNLQLSLKLQNNSIPLRFPSHFLILHSINNHLKPQAFILSYHLLSL